jgi:hypothetical protein
MILTSLSLLILSVIAYTIKELQAHGKLKWGKHTDFWGNNSWMRKYIFKGNMYQDLPPDNWYYRTFRIKYKERFPGSATIFVTFTDGFHLMQFIFKLFLIGSLVMYKEIVNPWIDGLIYFAIWGVVFTIVYKDLSK